jgi:peptidyl-prolyl cis-trans isomerase-like protein 2
MIFELINILPWIKKHGSNPVTGLPLISSQLTKLNFTVQKEVYTCPITFKVFNEHTKIVAIKTTGNVYCYEAIETLNIKPKYWKDLLTDVPFTRKDIIVLQDPHHIESRDINKFHYITHAIPVSLPKPTPSVNTSTPALTPSFVKPASTALNAHYSDNTASMSFTSTTLNVNTQTSSALLTEEEYILRNVPKGAKAYVHMITTLGEINLELYAHEAPTTVYNFVKLSKSGTFFTGKRFLISRVL